MSTKTDKTPDATASAGAASTPEQYVQQKAAASGSSFYYAFLFLPPPRRAAITAFYAFCREVDDVVDEVSDPGVAATKLAWWRKEVMSAFGGQPSHPAMKALLPHVKDYDIRVEHLLAVIDGCQMDLEQTPTWTSPACSAIATWWRASWARWRRASSAAPTPRPSPTPTSWAWRCS